MRLRVETIIAKQPSTTPIVRNSERLDIPPSCRALFPHEPEASPRHLEKAQLNEVGEVYSQTEERGGVPIDDCSCLRRLIGELPAKRRGSHALNRYQSVGP